MEIKLEITKRAISTEAEWLDWRHTNINASEISALTGDHPWLTKYELWRVKTSPRKPDFSNSALKERGKRLEKVALEMAFEDHKNWISHTKNIYYAHPSRIGATPDAIIKYQASPHRLCLEIKTTTESRFKEVWSDGPPLYILDQIRIGMWLSDCDKGVIAVMTISYAGELKMEYFDVEQDTNRIMRLHDEVNNFCRSIEDELPPSPDFGRDLPSLKEGAGSKVETIDLSGDNEAPLLRTQYRTWQTAAKIASDKLDEIKAMMLFKMNGATLAKFNGEELARVTTVKKKAYSVKESSYTQFRFLGEDE